VAQDPFGSGFGVRRSSEARVLYSLKSRPFGNAISRIDLSHRSSEGHVASDPEGFGIRGFRTKRNLYHGFKIREIPKRTWQGGSPRQSGRQVAIHRSSKVRGPSLHVLSEFGVRDLVVSRVYDIAYSDFPIGKFPNRGC
jgi:hypothetical protein